MAPILELAFFIGVLGLHSTSASIIDYVFGTEQAPAQHDAVESAQNNRPTFCKEYQCPNFTVIQHNDNFDVRHYEPTTWVATESQGGWFVTWRMYVKLAKYMLRGYNDQDVRMSMTVPVLTKYTDSKPVEMLFMVPEEYQNNPPLPTDSTVTIVKMPAMEVYVRSFGGFASGYKYEQELKELKSSLSSGEPYEDDMMYRVGYDSPMTIFNRHNEVWLVKQ